MERLRLRFSRGDEVKFISHLDIMRLWERAMRRAALPLLYSEGFTPHPRFSLAAPLSLGITSDAELMDVYLGGQVSPQYLHMQINGQLPSGIAVHDVWSVGIDMPSLQSQIRFAEYLVTIEPTEGKTESDVLKLIAMMLAAEHIPWQHIRETSVRSYDLRSLIDDLALTQHSSQSMNISMKLRCDPGGSGRPEQVVKALGLLQRPQSIHRTALILN